MMIIISIKIERLFYFRSSQDSSSEMSIAIGHRQGFYLAFLNLSLAFFKTYFINVEMK
jgi:hypothetical protein